MRLFVALNLPAAVREAVWVTAGPLRERGFPVKWVRPEALHLTLKFLGQVAEAREPELLAALTQAAGERPDAVAPSRSVTLALEGFGAFPDPRRPRVVWAGIAPDAALELLQHRVEAAFGPLGFASEGRPFRPHLTLGRVEQGFRGLEAALAGLGELAETVLVEAVDLMQSTPQRGGSVYHVRGSARLG